MSEYPPTKHVHFVGICGVAMSALAGAFHKKGWNVTGSDKGFYPPVSTYLTEAGIPYYAGWHPEKMAWKDAVGTEHLPDLVIAGTAAGTQNPEIAYATEHHIPIKFDSEIRGEYFAKKNSIVCAGTWGKTSSTALLSHILIEAGLDPSFVIGGLSLSTDSAHLGDSDWSVIEGDEYKSSPWDIRPKFAHIKTTHLLLTAVSWDHADVYPTEASYFDVFEKYIQSLPPTGLIVAESDDAGARRVIAHAPCRVVSYGEKDIVEKTAPGTAPISPDYKYHSIEHTKNGLSFFIDTNTNTKGKKTTYKITCPILGRYNADNITGCFAMACEIGIPADKIIAAIASFKGIKRRLEKRYEGDITILDCHAPTAEKAASVLESIREVYDKKIVVIFEPNIGGRQRESIAKYDHAFHKADTVLLPRFTKLKISAEELSGEKKQPVDGQELAAYISTTHPHTLYIEDDTALVKAALQEAEEKGDVIAFLGSHGFRGMIEETVQAAIEAVACTSRSI